MLFKIHTTVSGNLGSKIRERRELKIEYWDNLKIQKNKGPRKGNNKGIANEVEKEIGENTKVQT